MLSTLIRVFHKNSKALWKSSSLVLPSISGIFAAVPKFWVLFIPHPFTFAVRREEQFFLLPTTANDSTLLYP